MTEMEVSELLLNCQKATGAVSFINRQHIKLDCCSCIILTYHAVFIVGQIHSPGTGSCTKSCQKLLSLMIQHPSSWPQLRSLPNQHLMLFPAVPRNGILCNEEGAQKTLVGTLLTGGFCRSPLCRDHNLKPAFVLVMNLLTLCIFFFLSLQKLDTLLCCKVEGVSITPKTSQLIPKIGTVANILLKGIQELLSNTSRVLHSLRRRHLSALQPHKVNASSHRLAERDSKKYCRHLGWASSMVCKVAAWVLLELSSWF